MSDHIFFDFAIYYLPVPEHDPLAVLDRLLQKDFSQFRKVEQLSKDVSERTILVDLRDDVAESYAPPDMESLQHFGRGLTRAQAESLQKCTTALIISFGHPKELAWDTLRSATQLMLEVSRETGGLIWDEETREVFTPEAWKERRLDGWNEPVPDISRHTTIHAYKSGEFVRAITLGMVKFGLPDVVVSDFSWSLNRNMGHLMNLFAQAVAEGTSVAPQGYFDLDLKSIKQPEVRKSQLSALKPNAEPIAKLVLREGKWEEGDPDNRLIEIGFDRYPGRDKHARESALLMALFGYEDSISYIQHDEAILAASQRAKQKLPALRGDFAAGLRPGEFIQVKAPFATPDGGNEWMWVEVTSWNGEEIEGLLRNEPFDIPDLHAGQVVTVSQDDVFDYIRRFPDGRQEGNETGKLIQQSESDAAVNE